MKSALNLLAWVFVTVVLALFGPASFSAAQQPKGDEGVDLVPLDQMTADQKYNGEDGGLYGKGENVPPESHMKAALAATAKIKPLDADGKPSRDGKIVLMSVGWTDPGSEFEAFKRSSDLDTERNPAVVVVNSAQNGRPAAQWSTADGPVWKTVEQNLEQCDVTTKQVQAIWLEQAIAGPSRYGAFPGHAKRLEDFIIKDIGQCLQHYPNLQVIYLSSRIWGGYAPGDPDAEPFAYETAFTVRWIIQNQIKGDAALNFDPAKGEMKAPVVLWGPYLWADGAMPRKSDGLAYVREDFGPDGKHIGPGSDKVGKLLTRFLKTDPTTKGWYLKPGVNP